MKDQLHYSTINLHLFHTAIVPEMWPHYSTGSGIPSQDVSWLIHHREVSVHHFRKQRETALWYSKMSRSNKAKRVTSARG